MALHFQNKDTRPDGLTLSLDFTELPEGEHPELQGTFFPAEWFPQSGIQLTWPHADTDWAPLLEEAEQCYLRMAYEIASRQPLLIVTPEPDRVRTLLTEQLPAAAMQRIRFFECPTNDTWARDHGFITLLSEGRPQLLDFRFNGWGQKFASNHDNLINLRLAEADTLCGTYQTHADFVLEGGAIESDGRGTLLTTSPCLLAPNRNEPLTHEAIEAELKLRLHVERVLWLDHGYLAGDDTDSHVDTLARLCSPEVIAYVQCTDPTDEHYEELKRMEDQLRTFRTAAGKPYTLIPLPMPEAIYDPEDEAQRLPATYANFLIMNTAVLMPTYAQPHLDERARRQLQQAFPRHEIVGIDCRALIRQHGSLHCCTMQFPLGVFK